MRIPALAALLPALLLAVPVTPAAALTAKQKMETCKFGADNDKLTGKPRDAFIKKCMAHGNYEPAARKDAMKSAKKMKKTKSAAKKPAAKPMPNMAPAKPKPQ